MHHSLIAIPLLLALPTGLAQEFPVKAEAEQTVRRSFFLESTQELQTMSQTVNGEDQSGQMPDIERSTERSFELVLVDRYEAVEDGRPTSFVRGFELIEGSVLSVADFGGQSNENEFTLVSDLTDEEVLFQLEEGAWEASATEDSSVDDAYLNGLVAELQFLQLLPEGAVEKDEEWEVDLDILGQLTRPGGELGLHPEDDDSYEPGDPNPEPERSGSITATFTGMEEEDGASYAAIALVIDVETIQDLSEEMRAQFERMAEQSDGPAPEVDMANRSFATEGEGRALWDLERGRLHSLELTRAQPPFISLPDLT